jgi:hypothetical protein
MRNRLIRPALHPSPRARREGEGGVAAGHKVAALRLAVRPPTLAALDLSRAGSGGNAIPFSRRVFSPEPCQRQVEKAQSVTFVRLGRAVAPAFVTIMLCKLPGFASLNPGYEKESRKRNAGRRGSYLPHLAARPRADCAARPPVGVPPQFLARGTRHPKGSVQARLPGTRSEWVLPIFACPSPVKHLTDRS